MLSAHEELFRSVWSSITRVRPVGIEIGLYLRMRSKHGRNAYILFGRSPVSYEYSVWLNSFRKITDLGVKLWERDKNAIWRFNDSPGKYSPQARGTRAMKRKATVMKGAFALVLVARSDNRKIGAGYVLSHVCSGTL